MQFFFGILVLGMATYVLWNLNKARQTGESLATWTRAGAAPGPKGPNQEIQLLRDLWARIACVALFMVAVIVGMVTTGNVQSMPQWLFLVHRLVAIMFVVTFVCVRFLSARINPTMHRLAGYTAMASFAFVMATGAWYLF